MSASGKEIEAKFRQCCALAKKSISERNIEEVIASINNLEASGDAGRLAGLL